MSVWDGPPVPWLEAYMWFCEDDVCECTQPQIDRLTRNIESGRPWIRREEVWRGTFRSQADSDERQVQENELREAATKFKVPLDEKALYGCCPEVPLVSARMEDVDATP